eukprot:m.344270 g.344270  ORF g.344270 m.344270 type:complete len:262 (+) comp24099_c0_seq1:235-1020(+)
MDSREEEKIGSTALDALNTIFLISASRKVQDEKGCDLSGLAIGYLSFAAALTLDPVPHEKLVTKIEENLELKEEDNQEVRDAEIGREIPYEPEGEDLVQKVCPFNAQFSTFSFTVDVMFHSFNKHYPKIAEGIGPDGKCVFQCHGLGPIYHAKQSHMTFYLYCKGEQGPHKRGIRGNGGCLISKNPLPLDVWLHVRIVKLPLSLEMYINDELEAQDTTVPGCEEDDFQMKPCSHVQVKAGSFGTDSYMDGRVRNFKLHQQS